MKKWSGGMLIAGLACMLLLRYIFMARQPRRQSAYDFFNKHPTPSNDFRPEVRILNESAMTQDKSLFKPIERPTLINYDGLDDLYNNLSVLEFKSLLAWAQMRTLLSRSDALPETSQGIKEAAVAWRELLYTMEDNKAAKLHEFGKTHDVPIDEVCPYSISVLNFTSSSGGSNLAIPCGLVYDSSITVIGIPDAHKSSFQIELIGSQLPQEPKPPIVLRYDVVLPGDNLTKEAVIIQNAWTNENGWGREERCPNHKFTLDQKVDGLKKCNAHFVTGTLEDNSNATNGKFTNSSLGTAHAYANFPFVEGNPFTATLWVGLEGFHMTVNGRHETSFVFREKLEPCLVSGVKVEGGVKIVSALAKALPVSENTDLAVDIDHLRAPTISKKRLVMFIGVFSTGNNFERRMALRRSWMQYEAVRLGDVAVRFFIALDKNRQVNLAVWKEAQVYGDIQLMPFVDYYSLLTLKTIAICILGTKILPAKYMMKTDDDAFVRIDEILSSLKGRVSDGLLYGHISFESEPHRDKDNKWYISTKEWPNSSYPPWAHGPGYIISRDIAKFVVQGHQETVLKLFKLEDVAMGIWIEQFRNGAKQVQYINDERFFIAGCESNYVLSHYQNPRMLLCLWDKLLKEHEPNCCD